MYDEDLQYIYLFQIKGKLILLLRLKFILNIFLHNFKFLYYNKIAQSKLNLFK
jgi:hypothetical protein